MSHKGSVQNYMNVDFYAFIPQSKIIKQVIVKCLATRSKVRGKKMGEKRHRFAENPKTHTVCASYTQCALHDYILPLYTMKYIQTLLTAVNHRGNLR